MSDPQHVKRIGKNTSKGARAHSRCDFGYEAYVFRRSISSIKFADSGVRADPNPGIEQVSADKPDESVLPEEYKAIFSSDL